MRFPKYTQNLRQENNEIWSYQTHVATIKGSQLLVHGHWSQTTSKHVNYVANHYGLEKIEAEKPEQELKKEDHEFKTIAMIAKLGDFFGQTDKEKNDWKKRMLNAGLKDRGLEFPEDWDTLSEETKKARLDGAVKIIE